VVSCDASHPDVRGVKPSNKNSSEKAKKPPDALRRLFVFRKTLMRERLTNHQPLTHHVYQPSSPSPLFASAKRTPTTTCGITTGRGSCIHGLPTPFTKERIRRSLGTKDVTVARERRDNFFTHLTKQSTSPVLSGQAAVA